MKKVSFITLGCKVNQYESNGMAQKLMGKYEIVDQDQIADIYIVNTCSVTNIADRKSRQALRRCKEHNKDALVIAVGCYVDTGKEDLEKIEEVDLLLNNYQKRDIDKYIESYYEGKKLDDKQIESYFYDFGDVTYTEKTRATIKVQDGCNSFCSYCIIPYARGRICSREPKSVISEIEKIAQNGIKEVVINGIQISSYGTDFENDYRLIDLLEDINNISGIERIRLGSLSPTLITDDFCNRLKKVDKICHHFHLSLQSGCDKTLKMMNRKYTSSDFDKVVQRLRNLYSDVILTTDIIVGFPDETDEDFEITYEYLKKIKFYKMHVFKYSPRRGTVASKMKNQVPGDVKEKRSRRLLELSSENEKEYLKLYVGKTVKVLFEEREGEFLKGHTANYILVKARMDDSNINKICDVEIKDFEEECLKD